MRVKVYPGDIKYVDVNADGVIDVDDRVPLSFSNVPEIQYGFAGEVSWKNLTLGMLFEGTGHSTYFWEVQAITLSVAVRQETC